MIEENNCISTYKLQVTRQRIQECKHLQDFLFFHYRTTGVFVFVCFNPQISPLVRDCTPNRLIEILMSKSLYKPLMKVNWQIKVSSTKENDKVIPKNKYKKSFTLSITPVYQLGSVLHSMSAKERGVLVPCGGKTSCAHLELSDNNGQNKLFLEKKCTNDVMKDLSG